MEPQFPHACLNGTRTSLQKDVEAPKDGLKANRKQNEGYSVTVRSRWEAGDALLKLFQESE